MSKIKFSFEVVEQQSTDLIPRGLHTATVKSVNTVMSRTGTPQIEVQFLDKLNRVRNKWFNLKGFRRNEAGQYLDKKNEVINLEGLEGDDLQEALNRRVVDKEATNKAMEIVAKFANHCGLEEGTKLNQDTIGDLEGSEVLISVVGNPYGGDMINNTFATSAVEAAERNTSKHLGYEVSLDEEEDEEVIA